MKTFQVNRIVFGVIAATVMVCGMPLQDAEAQHCAPSESIEADRPGELTGPSVVAKGSLQIESGWEVSRTSGNTAQAIGTSLFRVPVTCRAELRIAAGGYMFDHSPSGEAISGLADGYLGTKIRLMEGSGLRPHLAVIAGSSIPVGGEFSHRRAEPEGSLSASWELPYGQSILGFAGLASRVAGTSRESERIAGASWEIPLGEQAGTFVEVVEFSQRDERSRYISTGLRIFPSATLQVDGFVTVPPTHAGSDVAFGVGVARRW